MKTTIPLLLAAMLAAIVPTASRAEDLHVLYEEGKAAFHAGQYELARERLSVVLAKSPGHLPTQAMMAQIVQKIGPDNTMLRKTYEKVVLERVEFAEVPLDDAIQAVRHFAQKASQNKVTPNIIIKSPELSKKTVTINLTQVPLSEVLNYIAQLSGAKLVYDKTAVLFVNPAEVRPSAPTPVAPSTTTGPATPAPGTPTTRQALDRNSLPFYLADPFARKS
jgi:hypothetical protein